MIRDAKHGSWTIHLPTEGSPVLHYACLTVTYRGGHIECCYDSTLHEEVGPMGHYENDDYIVNLDIPEDEVTSREEAIRRIMAFVPRTDDLPGPPPAKWHAIRLSTLPDKKLRKLLSPCLR